eukprot:9032662-Alexandrium_andersonii.AAC.1
MHMTISATFDTWSWVGISVRMMNHAWERMPPVSPTGAIRAQGPFTSTRARMQQSTTPLCNEFALDARNKFNTKRPVLFLTLR